MDAAPTAALVDEHDAPTNTGVPNKKLAMWAFLASDCMFFGTLISTHLIYRRTTGYQSVREIFDIELTSFSTFILLLSSFFMALAVSAMHRHNLRAFRGFTLGVLLFGGVFIGCQVYEFSHFVHEKGLTLTSDIFGSTFYTLTGTHGIHVCLGLFWLLCLFIYSYSPKFSVKHAIDVEVAGLYWHFVDIVWVVIFPFVYILEYIVN